MDKINTAGVRVRLQLCRRHAQSPGDHPMTLGYCPGCHPSNPGVCRGCPDERYRPTLKDDREPEDAQPYSPRRNVKLGGRGR